MKKGNDYKKRNKNIKKENYLNYKNLKIVIILLLIFFLFILDINKKVKSNEQIIYENKYSDFENIKLKFNKDIYLNSHLRQISILTHIFNKNFKRLKKNKINVHICVSLNNQYIYPLLVSIVSVLINSNKKKTFLIYHILCAPDVTENSLKILKSLMNRYSLELEMIFYNMSNTFIYLKKTRLSQVTYYRLLLPIFIDLKRILYLDGDTLTYKDLSEIFQLDFKNNYILGTLDYLSYGVDYLGLTSNKYINAGVILINLEKIRRDKKYYDLINITTRYRLKNDDQTAINYVLYPDIGILPTKYNIFNFYDVLDMKIYSKKLRTKINIKELEEVIKNPTIIHHVICGPKIWKKSTTYFSDITGCKKRNNCSCIKYHYKWIYIKYITNNCIFP